MTFRSLALPCFTEADAYSTVKAYIDTCRATDGYVENRNGEWCAVVIIPV